MLQPALAAAAATFVLLTPTPAFANHGDDDESEICIFRVGLQVGDFEFENELCLEPDD